MPPLRTLHSLKPVAGLLAVAAALAWLRPAGHAALLPAGLGGLMLALWLLAPVALARLQQALERAAARLAEALALLTMLLVYFLVLTPVAVLMRTAGRDELQRRAAPGATLWQAPAPRDRGDDFFKVQF